MSKKLFDKLNSMSVDEIINENFSNEQPILTEEFEHPFTIEETEMCFLQGEGGLTEEMIKDLPLITEEELREIKLPTNELIKIALEDFDRELEKDGNSST